MAFFHKIFLTPRSQRHSFNLNKAQQNTNWLKRPLSQSQINYALLDVKYLHDLWDVLANKLDKANRLGWLWEDQQFLISPQTYQIDMTIVWKKIKSTKINPKTMGARSFLHLQKLCEWRERKAQSLNYNRGRVISDDALMQLIQNPPENLDTLMEYNLHHDEVLLIEIWDVLQNANRLPRELWPILKKGLSLTGDQMVLLDKLKTLQVQIAEIIGISPRILSNTDDLKSFCCGKRDINFLKGWRHELFGAKALKL